jgi:hypothetical protein
MIFNEIENETQNAEKQNKTKNTTEKTKTMGHRDTSVR